MRCLYPRTVGYKSDGRTISWSSKQYSKEYPVFQLPCSKCIECRLEYARQWAVRCVHEAKMHEENSFITLTYSDQHLESPRLQYRDFQLFMKRLRRSEPSRTISTFVTGEYGDKTKRPHWHAIIFNYRPRDLVPIYKNENGDQLYKSESLDEIWGKNDSQKKPNEVGDVTFKSAGYVARYAAKKLVHGLDGEHDYQPISKKSSKRAIGKTWLEHYWRDLLKGTLTMSDGSQLSVPRYYEKWMQAQIPLEEWLCYLDAKQKVCSRSLTNKQREESDTQRQNDKRRLCGHMPDIQTTKLKTKVKIINEKFKRLQKHLKET